MTFYFLIMTYISLSFFNIWLKWVSIQIPLVLLKRKMVLGCKVPIIDWLDYDKNLNN